MTKTGLIDELLEVMTNSKELEFYQLIKDSETCNLPVELRKKTASEVVDKLLSLEKPDEELVKILKRLLGGEAVEVENDTEFIVGADIEKTKRGIRRLKKELEKWSKK